MNPVRKIFDILESLQDGKNNEMMIYLKIYH